MPDKHSALAQRRYISKGECLFNCTPSSHGPLQWSNVHFAKSQNMKRCFYLKVKKESEETHRLLTILRYAAFSKAQALPRYIHSLIKNICVFFLIWQWWTVFARSIWNFIPSWNWKLFHVEHKKTLTRMINWLTSKRICY